MKHLLIPKEHRIFCNPKRPLSAKIDFTRFPSECECTVCLSAFRRLSTTGKKKRFKSSAAKNYEFRPAKICENCGTTRCICENGPRWSF